jgi:FAD/FMN-containing dehydrogenase
MLGVFLQELMKRLRALKAEHDPDNLFSQDWCMAV